MSYDVFISCKSEDYCYAEEIYNFLKNNGFNVFLANKELRQMGDSEYRRAISQALKSTYHLIVFASKPEYVDSTWVYYEWDWFLVAKIKGKKQGQLLTILKDVSNDDINADLWKYESKTFDEYKESLLPYVETPEFLKRKKEAEEKAKLEEEKRKLEKEVAEKKKRLINQIDEESADYLVHNSILESKAMNIIEMQKQVGRTSKKCPVCHAIHPIETYFCKKCGWTFNPIFESTPKGNKEHLFIMQGLWEHIKRMNILKGEQNEKISELEDKCKNCIDERDKLKDRLTKLQKNLNDLEKNNSASEAESKKQLHDALNEKFKLKERVNKLTEDNSIISTELASVKKDLNDKVRLLRSLGERYDIALTEIENLKNDLNKQKELRERTQFLETILPFVGNIQSDKYKKLNKQNLIETIIKCCKKPFGRVFGTDKLDNIGFDENKFRDIMQDDFGLHFGEYEFSACITFDQVKQLVARKANIVI